MATNDINGHDDGCACRQCDAQRRKAVTDNGLAFWRTTGYGRLEIRLHREPRRMDVVQELNRVAARADRLHTALEALTEWGRTHTSPLDANTPHQLLIAATEALKD